MLGFESVRTSLKSTCFSALGANFFFVVVVFSTLKIVVKHT